MIIIDGIMVQDEIIQTSFVCDLSKCHGACCIEGDAGAPLLPEEIQIIEDVLERVTPYMTEKGIATIKETGVFEMDHTGMLVTPLIDNGDCAYINYDHETAVCAFELAFQAGKTNFQKPQSCHLYPIRVGKLSTGDFLVYHKWNICRPALKKGKTQRIPMYVFLKKPLIRLYGEEWYNKLLAYAKENAL
jgi:hypothetical protein